jgi:hypothetical protein
MKPETKIAIFKGKKIRRHWDDENEKWYFSVVDVVEALTKTERPRKYWDDLKRKLKQEGSQLSEKIGQLKFEANDEKKYPTYVADTETLIDRIISLFSPV